MNDDNYPDTQFNSSMVEVLLSTINLQVILDNIYSAAIEISPEPSEEQTAWDNLTRLEENLKNYEKSTIDCKKSFESYKNGEILLNTFLESRNSILNNLFAEIKDRFVELYRQLHGIDEIDFDALLVSEGAGVDFKVDFHGRGVNASYMLFTVKDTRTVWVFVSILHWQKDLHKDLLI